MVKNKHPPQRLASHECINTTSQQKLNWKLSYRVHVNSIGKRETEEGEKHYRATISILEGAQMEAG